MKRVWHRSHPELLQKLRAEINERYPDLTIFVEGDAVRLRGSFPVEHEGKVLDGYQVEVELPPDWPDVTPILRETGGRIPRIADRHVNLNGDACPIVPEEWLLNPAHESLIAFLEGPVQHFFISQSLVEQGEPWPFGERPHGKPGLLQAYGEWFGTTDEKAIRLYLEYLSRREIKGHWECPCGLGKRLRNCHLEHVKELRKKIPPSVAAAALKSLKGQK
jgi:hypothetical protein